MAFPDYSLLVVETYDPIGLGTTRQSYMFTDVKDAIVAYNNEVAQAHKRVFLFEQPQPTKFHRNDEVPVIGHLDQWD